MTPVIWAVYHGQLAICKRLVAANCSLDVVGRINHNHNRHFATAFHCAVLLEHFNIAEFLLLADYDLRFEKYLVTNDGVPDTLVKNYEFWGELCDIVKNVRSLCEMCRRVIRKQVGVDICNKVDQLPIPARFKQYIIMTDLTS
jgi:ankyrin repeat protein